jgi:zinc finger BED domain-containing protein 1 (E3 SUMO-protein ligase ZBED1)
LRKFNINPLGWWSSNEYKYPSVAIVARAYLGIPATSVASERVFSKCGGGGVCTERRSMLSPQHVQQLVVVGQNLGQ